MELHTFVANDEKDRAEFLNFDSCGDDASPWAVAADIYASTWATRKAAHCLGLRDNDGRLAAVSAFDPRSFDLSDTGDLTEGWHLQVIAVRHDLHNRRVADDVFALTWAHMLVIDNERLLVSAHVHRDNAASLRCCERNGLSRTRELEDGYLLLLGVVPAMARDD